MLTTLLKRKNAVQSLGYVSGEADGGLGLSGALEPAAGTPAERNECHIFVSQ